MKVRDFLISIIQKLERNKLKNKNFVIISSNCWGAEIYNWLGKEYNTPFVGLFLYGPCFIKLLENFENLIITELKFIKTSKYFETPPDYPLGCLEDVEIHFLHYKTTEEAKAKWDRRVVRMLKERNFDNYFFKLCDRELIDNDVLDRFNNLPYKNKVSFGINYFLGKDYIRIIENDKNMCVPDGVKLYKITYRYFDIIKWLQVAKRKKTLFSYIKTILYKKEINSRLIKQ